MKNRFKFRFWRWQTNDEGNGLIRVQCLPDLMSVDGSAEPYDNGDGGAYCHFEDVICEQCTGFKDKNGKDIYEGDVVEYSYYSQRYVGVVIWDDVKVGFALKQGLGVFPFEPLKSDFKFEVVGNVHEKEFKNGN